MLKKSLKGGKRGGGALPLRSVLMFFFFVFAPFEFRRPDYLETTNRRKKYISAFKQKRIRVDGAFISIGGQSAELK